MQLIHTALPLPPHSGNDGDDEYDDDDDDEDGIEDPQCMDLHPLCLKVMQICPLA